jgi:hypothetical protein
MRDVYTGLYGYTQNSLFFSLVARTSKRRKFNVMVNCTSEEIKKLCAEIRKLLLHFSANN